MSRAFVKESDLPDEPIFAPAALLPPGTKNLITPEGATTLRAQLDHLLNVVRPPLTAPGQDIEVKTELQRLDHRIRAIEESLRTAEIVPPPPESDGSIRFGATVTVKETKSGRSTYRIVGVDEIDLDRGWISWLSPLARALLSSKKGDRVQFHSPAGMRDLQVLDVHYEVRPAVSSKK